VVFFPAGQAFSLRSNADLETRQIRFLLQSGRAVLYPVYRGTFDRWVEPSSERNERDLVIQDVKDFSRSVDYLETRPDIDRDRLAYYGNSAGANIAPLVLATDKRLKAAVLLAGGLPLSKQLPEIDQINFLPPVTTSSSRSRLHSSRSSICSRRPRPTSGSWSTTPATPSCSSSR
jgi:poly(3-hydroxybutyrate) depolymerase